MSISFEDALAYRGENKQYSKMGIDTIQRSKANHTIEQQKAICQFMIDKYINRDKGQDTQDIAKARDYIDWLESLIEIEKGNIR